MKFLFGYQAQHFKMKMGFWKPFFDQHPQKAVKVIGSPYEPLIITGGLCGDIFQCVNDSPDAAPFDMTKFNSDAVLMRELL
jgi:hypothetical protein